MNTLGLILAGDRPNEISSLTKRRSISALPFAAKYRMIDLTLSNMVNSGIIRVGILTQFNSRSLIDHLGNGREWDLDRRNGGIFILQPIITSDNPFWYRGTADAIFQNISLLKRSPEEYVVIGSGNHIYKYDYHILKNYHLQKDADITLLIRKVGEDSLNKRVILNDQNRIIEISDSGIYEPMGIYFIKKELLIDLLYSSIQQEKYDIFENLIKENLKYLRIVGCPFNGYWMDVTGIESYIKANFDILKEDIRKELFYKYGKIYTKLKNMPSPKFNITAKVKNSLVGDGCVISGTVENSIVFRNVVIKAGAYVKDSIVMQGSTINEGATVKNAILDKEVTVKRDNVVSDNNITIIEKGKTV